MPHSPVARSFASSADLTLWQGMHVASRLESASVPPRCRGVMWSTSTASVNLSARLHCAHKPQSRRRMRARIATHLLPLVRFVLALGARVPSCIVATRGFRFVTLGMCLPHHAGVRANSGASSAAGLARCAGRDAVPSLEFNPFSTKLRRVASSCARVYP